MAAKEQEEIKRNKIPLMSKYRGCMLCQNSFFFICINIGYDEYIIMAQSHYISPNLLKSIHSLLIICVFFFSILISNLLCGLIMYLYIHTETFYLPDMNIYTKKRKRNLWCHIWLAFIKVNRKYLKGSFF